MAHQPARAHVLPVGHQRQRPPPRALHLDQHLQGVCAIRESVPVLSAAYTWRCLECQAFGSGGAPAFATHYRVNHQVPVATYTGFLIEARDEHGLTGADAYQWAHSAYAEYINNQK